MAKKVRWSPQSIADIDEICKYISKDSQTYAFIFAQRIFAATETIALFPYSSRMVPEKQDEKLHKKGTGAIYSGTSLMNRFRGNSSLVCQYLENISRKALEDYQEIIRQFVRGRHGIYALYRGTKLYYVGLASNLRSRLHHHLRDRHAQTWDRFSIYLTLADGHLKELETLVLRIAEPKGNRQTGKFSKAEDLKRRFRKLVHQHLRSEEENLFGEAENRKASETASKVKRNGRIPKLAPYVSKRFKIRLDYKGKRYFARVRSNGLINFRSKIYTSPSFAAMSAMKRRTANGWYWWQYERAPGDWVKLAELRKQ